MCVLCVWPLTADGKYWVPHRALCPGGWALKGWAGLGAQPPCPFVCQAYQKPFSLRTSESPEHVKERRLWPQYLSSCSRQLCTQILEQTWSGNSLTPIFHNCIWAPFCVQETENSQSACCLNLFTCLFSAMLCQHHSSVHGGTHGAALYSSFPSFQSGKCAPTVCWATV